MQELHEQVWLEQELKELEIKRNRSCMSCGIYRKWVSGARVAGAGVEGGARREAFAREGENGCTCHNTISPARGWMYGQRNTKLR